MLTLVGVTSLALLWGFSVVILFGVLNLYFDMKEGELEDNRLKAFLVGAFLVVILTFSPIAMLGVLTL